MNAIEVAKQFEEVAPMSCGLQYDQDVGFLGFRFGDPHQEVTGVGVAWYLSIEVILQAIDKELNFLLIHEPHIFYSNKSPWHTCVPADTNPVNLARKRLLLEHNLCVYTAHSNWDLQSTVGMQPTFAKALGFTDEIRRDAAVGVYKIGPMPFSDLINHVKGCLGLEHLRVQGDPDKLVKTVAVGFGGMGPAVDAVLANEADAGIFGELNEFSFIVAREANVGLIETTHLVSESIGFSSAVDVMKERLPGIPVEFLEVPFPFNWR